MGFRRLLAALGVALALTMSTAQAGTILVFGQSGINAPNGLIITNTGTTGALGGTVLSAANLKITITGIANSSALPASFPAAYLNLSAVSVTDATVNGFGHITQNFTGSFSITSGLGGSGVNYLSGTFNDSLFGQGASLALSASGSSGVPSFTSDVISTLGQIRGISLAFSNVTPAAFVTAKNTLGAGSANVAGTFSATVPEPGSVALLGIGLSGLFTFRRFFRRAAVA